MFIWAKNLKEIETEHVFQSETFFISVATPTQVASAPLIMPF